VNILIGSHDDATLEKLGVSFTDWGFIPFFADDQEVLLHSVSDRSLEHRLDIQMVVIDTTIASTNLVPLIRDIRTNQISGYIYICILFEERSIVDQYQQNQWRCEGADLVLSIDTPMQTLRSYMEVAKRMMQHQLQQRILQQSLWNQAHHDPLTELPNRRSILSSLERQSTLAQQRNQALGLLMLDLDFFKNINDTYGHDCGDAVLKEAASRMKHCMRNTDAVGRFGGEEFLAVVPNCSGEELHRLAERIRLSMKHPVLYKKQLIPISTSIGASVHFASDDNVLDSLGRADQALYLAKEMGRDRVVCAWMMDEYESKIG